MGQGEREAIESRYSGIQVFRCSGETGQGEREAVESPGHRASFENSPDSCSTGALKREIGELRLMTRTLVRLSGAVLAITLLTAALRVVGPRWHLANLSMLYLVVIQLTAIAGGRAPAILAAVLSFLAINWYFLDPVGHLSVANPDEWLVLLMLLAAGLVSGQMAATMKARAETALQREQEMSLLYELGNATVGQDEVEPILSFLTTRVQEQFGGAPCEFLLWDRDDQTRPLTLPSQTGSRPMAEFALRSGKRDFGRMRVGRRGDGWPHSSEDRRLLDAVARHAALAIERGRLAHEAREARLLRDSDALKSKLLSAVSHDLRTPLTGIKALTTTLLQSGEELPPPVVREALEGINEETDRMTRLIRNLLDLSRIEAGVLRPHREPVLVADLIDDTLHRLTGILADRTVVRKISNELPVAHLDYVQVQQVLTNLLENAVRYTPVDSPIIVGASMAEGAIGMWVTDFGPGIPGEEQERIFDRFYRLEHHETEHRGTGMGLAISRGLVQAHGGRIWVEETSGGGATFRMRIPIHADGTAEADPGR